MFRDSVVGRSENSASLRMSARCRGLFGKSKEPKSPSYLAKKSNGLCNARGRGRLSSGKSNTVVRISLQSMAPAATRPPIPEPRPPAASSWMDCQLSVCAPASHGVLGLSVRRPKRESRSHRPPRVRQEDAAGGMAILDAQLGSRSRCRAMAFSMGDIPSGWIAYRLPAPGAGLDGLGQSHAPGTTIFEAGGAAFKQHILAVLQWV